MYVVQIVVQCFNECVLVCPAGCFNGGYCSSPGICTCASGWTGNDCRQGMMWGLQTHICGTYSQYEMIFEKLYVS